MVTWRGTQAGPFAGAAPTGESVAFETYHIARFEGGKVAEWWGTADIRGLDLRGDDPVEGRLANGLRKGSHTSSNLVGGRAIAGLSVQMVPNNRGGTIFLSARAGRFAGPLPARHRYVAEHTISP